MKLYITKSRTHYPQNGDVEIILYGRTPQGNAEKVTVEGFEPYFYVPQEEATELVPKDHSDLRRVEVTDVENLNVSQQQAKQQQHPTVVDEMPVTESLKGERLARVVVTHPGGVPKLKEQYDKTYEADVQFTDRLRIDQEIYTGIEVDSRTVTPDEITPVDMDTQARYHYYDIETDDRGSIPVQGGEVVHTDSEIVTITSYDSFDEEYIAFLNLKERPVSEVLPEIVETGEKPGCIDTIVFERNEKELLRTYFQYIQDSNPDVLLAWNNLGFDAPYLIERAKAINVSTGTLGRKPERNATSGQYDPEISGRVVYDLMKAWKRMQYSDVSKALDNAASIELDDAAKIEHEESLFELWRSNVSKLLKYNARDVKLMVDINDAAGVMDDRCELKNTVGAEYESTYESNDFIEILTRRMLHEWNKAGPTKTPPSGGGKDDDYEGAYTFPAFEGRRTNVVQIDLASLYPLTMRMINSSPETLIDVSDTPQVVAQARDDVVAAPNGAVFSQEEDGIFRALVDKALELTQQAGRRRDKHPPGSDEWVKHNKSREARKRIRNGLYGVLGWVWFFLYDEPVAESVTTMAQEVIKLTAEYVDEETEGEVIYGDTDSNYISYPDEWSYQECLEATEDAIHELNQSRYPQLAEEWGMDADECEWEIEIEDMSSVMMQCGSKKRYGKKLIWVEGMDFDETLDETEYKIAGFEYKRSDSSKLTKQLQKDVIMMILDREDESKIRERIFNASKRITRCDPDWDLIGKPGGIGSPLDSYDSDTASVRAAKTANTLFDLGFGESDKPKRVYLEEDVIEHNGESVETDVIGFDSADEIEPVTNDIYVDVPRMTEVTITKPIGRVVETVGIDIDAAIAGKKQEKISDWI